MKSILNISVYRALIITAIVFTTFVVVFFTFNSSFTNTSLFNEVEACCGSGGSGGGAGGSGGGGDGGNNEGNGTHHPHHPHHPHQLVQIQSVRLQPVLA